MLHGVRHEASKERCDVGAVAIGRTKENAVAHIVAHGEVPPQIGLSSDPAVYPFHRLAVNVGHHGVARPHDVHILVEL